MIRTRLATAGAVLLLAGQALACSSDDDAAEEDSDVTTTEQEPRSTNAQAAAFSGPLDGGEGVNLVTAGGGPSLDDAGSHRGGVRGVGHGHVVHVGR